MDIKDAEKLLGVRKLDKENIMSSYDSRVKELSTDSSIDPIQKYMKQSKLDEARDFLLKQNLTGEEIVEEKKNSFKENKALYSEDSELRNVPIDEELIAKYVDLKAEELYSIYVGKGIKLSQIAKEENPVTRQIEKFVESCVYANGQMDRVDEYYDSAKQRIEYVLSSYIREVCEGENINYFESDGVYFIEGEQLSIKDGWNSIYNKLLVITSKNKLKQAARPNFDKLSDVMEVAGDVKNLAVKNIKSLFNGGKRKW